jgi:hypothetical protein
VEEELVVEVQEVDQVTHPTLRLFIRQDTRPEMVVLSSSFMLHRPRCRRPNHHESRPPSRLPDPRDSLFRFHLRVLPPNQHVVPLNNLRLYLLHDLPFNPPNRHRPGQVSNPHLNLPVNRSRFLLHNRLHNPVYNRVGDPLSNRQVNLPDNRQRPPVHNPHNNPHLNRVDSPTVYRACTRRDGRRPNRV